MTFDKEVYKALGESPVTLDTSMDHVVVVDKLPITISSKQKKLEQFLIKKFSGMGKLNKETAYMPLDEEGNTLGFAFLEFSSKSEAEVVASRANGALFTKKSEPMRVTTWNDFSKYEAVGEELGELNIGSFMKECLDVQDWMKDEFVRDQFVLRYQNETEIYWNDPIRGEHMLACSPSKADGTKLTDKYAEWSSQGSYLATYHEQGIALWGGNDFRRLTRFAHREPKFMDFSPCERYVVTFNCADKDPNALIVWEVFSGRKLRSFTFTNYMRDNTTWPLLKWSFDGNYVAGTFSEDKLSIFSLPDMDIVDAPISIAGLRSFDWSPSDLTIAYWCPEIKDIPASASLMEIPSKRILRSQFLYQVSQIHLHWHPQGDFLCTKVARVTKKGQAVSSSFEIFSVREKFIPIESIEMKDKVVAFSWEPHAHRFSVIHGEGILPNVDFYSVKKSGVKLDFTLEKRNANSIYYSPTGKHLVLIGRGVKYGGGQLEFVSVLKKTSVKTQEHFSLTNVSWDPSGRYVTTSVIQPLSVKLIDSYKFGQNNGFKVWNLNGELMYERNQDRLYLFKWRPRPPSLLSREEMGHIRKTLRERYYKKFDEEDEAAYQSLLTGDLRKRAEAKRAYLDFRSDVKKWLVEIQPELDRLTGQDKEEWVEVERVLEEEIECFEEDILE